MDNSLFIGHVYSSHKIHLTWGRNSKRFLNQVWTYLGIHIPKIYINTPQARGNKMVHVYTLFFQKKLSRDKKLSFLHLRFILFECSLEHFNKKLLRVSRVQPFRVLLFLVKMI